MPSKKLSSYPDYTPGGARLYLSRYGPDETHIRIDRPNVCGRDTPAEQEQRVTDAVYHVFYAEMLFRVAAHPRRRQIVMGGFSGYDYWDGPVLTEHLDDVLAALYFIEKYFDKPTSVEVSS